MMTQVEVSVVLEKVVTLEVLVSLEVVMKEVRMGLRVLEAVVALIRFGMCPDGRWVGQVTFRVRYVHLDYLQD